MSHYLCAVVIPGEGDVKELVDALMKPYSEYDNENGWWDWYRIGGRWDGVLLSDRETWENNQCDICAGSGQDAIRHHYSDVHESPDKNCVPIERLSEDAHFYRVLTGDGTISQRHWDNCQICNRYFTTDDVSYEEYKAIGHPYDDPDSIWLPVMRNALIGWKGHRVVAVDYHS